LFVSFSEMLAKSMNLPAAICGELHTKGDSRLGVKYKERVDQKQVKERMGE